MLDVRDDRIKAAVRQKLISAEDVRSYKEAKDRLGQTSHKNLKTKLQRRAIVEAMSQQMESKFTQLTLAVNSIKDDTAYIRTHMATATEQEEQTALLAQIHSVIVKGKVEGDDSLTSREILAQIRGAKMGLTNRREAASEKAAEEKELRLVTKEAKLAHAREQPGATLRELGVPEPSRCGKIRPSGKACARRVRVAGEHCKQCKSEALHEPLHMIL